MSLSNTMKPRPYTIPKDAGGYPMVRQCRRCDFRWFQPVSGDECPKCFPRRIGPSCSENGILGYTNEEIETLTKPKG